MILAFLARRATLRIYNPNRSSNLFLATGSNRYARRCEYTKDSVTKIDTWVEEVARVQYPTRSIPNKNS